MRLSLTKHHGLGNDFLVLFDDQALPSPFDLGDLARRLCDRRRGIGADGLILGVTRPARDGAEVGMVLHNADGSRAEMSGNGIRCLAQAWLGRSGATNGAVVIATDAGVRVVDVSPGPDDRTILASVAMGAAETIGPPPGWDALGCDPGRPVAHLSLGNPHAVVAVDDVDAVDLAALGAKVPEVNLEVVAAGPGAGAITMRVHERGAGITEACGTGAVAAAHAAHAWGLADATDGEITVHMAGGDAKVRVGHELVLTGPATYIAHIEVPA
jgi:diaminopimelate epimerase